MTSAIAAALLLWIAQAFLPAGIRYGLSDQPLVERMTTGLGSRDVQPELGVYGERARRAQLNYAESLPVFITLALLHHVEPQASPTATTAAWVFVACRVAYVPAYLSGIPGVRSTAWSIAGAALLGMVAAYVGWW